MSKNDTDSTRKEQGHHEHLDRLQIEAALRQSFDKDSQQKRQQGETARKEHWRQIKARGLIRYIVLDWIVQRGLVFALFITLAQLVVLVLRSPALTLLNIIVYGGMSLIVCGFLAFVLGLISWVLERELWFLTIR